MRTGARFIASCLVTSFVALAISSTAVAAPGITGKLSKRGYTLIALAESDEARIVTAANGGFRVRAPARRVTLHLRAPDGTYAGPIVIGGENQGRRAILGVRAGARLGRVDVRPSKGYAKVSKTLSENSVDEQHWARARRGVPIGAGNFGFVRSKPPRRSPLGDPDADGIPDVLDVDDNGNVILDRLDRSSNAAAAGAAEERFGFFTRLTLTLPTTANANASVGLTQAQVQEQMNRAVSTSQDLLLTLLPSEPSPDYPELDCGGSIQQPPRLVGLVYCRPHASGGTGTIGRYPPTSNEMLFPDCCDLNANGLGTLTPEAGSIDPRGVRTLHTGATTEQIGTGDVMAQRVIRSGEEVAFLGAIDYVFASVPAIVSYDDRQGNATTVSYPYRSLPGTRDNGFPVRADGNGQVLVTLTFWRPQRRPIPPDANGAGGDACLNDSQPCDWLDIGGLFYEVQMEESGRRCPQTAFSTTDPDKLDLGPSLFGSPGFADRATDRASDPGNTITYTLNLTECLTSNGFTFNEGDDRAFSFLAVNPNGTDNAQQSIWFRRVP